MSNVDRPASLAQSPLTQKIVDAIKALLSTLSPRDQELVMREITRAWQPPTPRAGDVLGSVVRLLPKRAEVTVDEVKQHVASENVEASPKEIYNALGYLTRKGHLRRVGYGRYLVDGVLIVTSDDLGGEPARYED